MQRILLVLAIGAATLIATLAIAFPHAAKVLRDGVPPERWPAKGSFALLGRPELYLLATVAIILTVVMPSWGQIRKEPKAVV